MTYYKALKAGRRATNADYRYPTQGWTKHLAPETLTLCKIGYHIARDSQVLGWLNEELWEAEPCPDHPVVGADDKVVTCKVRLVRRVDGWNERTARLFAADCAEMALLGERDAGRELDPVRAAWTRRAISLARLYTIGEATAEEVRDAGDSVAALLPIRGEGRQALAYAMVSTINACDVPSRAAGAAIAATRAAWAAADGRGHIAAERAEAAAIECLYARLRLYLDDAVLPPVQPLYGVTR